VPNAESDAQLPQLLPARSDYQARLEMILPRSLTGVTYTANPAAAATVFVAMYVGAIDGSNPIRPMTVVWMSDAVAERRADADRNAYYQAAAAKAGNKAIDKLCAEWGIQRGTTWYDINSREPVRDESIKALARLGAIKTIAGISTTSSQGRYSLDAGFAALFDPTLTGDALAQEIERWCSTHLNPIARQRAALLRDPSRSDEAVVVTLPDGRQRSLHPGKSSLILKQLIERFVDRLVAPHVLFISQSGQPVDLIEGQALRDIGLSLDQLRLLPDCLIVDVDQDSPGLWFVEIVATDGPVDDERKQDLLDWATATGMRADQCFFVTAFKSRTAPVARKNLSRLAVGSYAWFADEPDSVLTWGPRMAPTSEDPSAGQ
jgi:hypothetical protein